jgi:hypothetical protein
LIAIKVRRYNRPQPRGTYGSGSLPSIRPQPEATEIEGISGTTN